MAVKGGRHHLHACSCQLGRLTPDSPHPPLPDLYFHLFRKAARAMPGRGLVSKGRCWLVLLSGLA